MEYIVSFVCGNHFEQRVINMHKEFSIGSSKKDNIFCKDFKAKQITVKISNDSFSVFGKAPTEFKTVNIPIPNIYLIDRDSEAVLYVDYVRDTIVKPIELPHNSTILIGRKKTNNVVINNKFISGEHCIIKRENGVFFAENISRTNGTYHNSMKISKTKLVSGDKIHIFNYTIRLEKGLLYFENFGNDIIFQNIPENISNEKKSKYKAGQERIYQRSPRTQEQLPHEDIVLAAPPSKQQKYEKSKGVFSSLVGSAAMVGTSMFTGGAMSAAMLAARSTMLIMPATNIATQKNSDKRSKKKFEDYEKLRELRFGNYLNEQRTRIMSVAQQQRKIITDENPSPEECLLITDEMRRNLWERTPLDRDFLDVRLGMGYEKLCISVKDRGEAYGIELEDDDAKEMSAMLVEESKYVDNIPVRVSLSKNTTLGVIGAREKVIQQVKNMVTEITCMHCYTDIKIVGIFDEKEKKQWESLRWLPHTWDDCKQTRFLAFDKETAHNLCDNFNDMLKIKKADLKDVVQTKKDVVIPYYIFILGSKEYMQDEEIMQNLLLNRPEMGVTTLFLFDDIYNLPNACNYIIDMDGYPGAYSRDKVNSKFLFTMDNVAPNAFDKFARSMSSIELRGFATAADIPSNITFLQGYGVKTVNELNILDRWAQNRAYKSLAAPIGIMSGEKLFSLNVRESKGSPHEHGPHGLVAGTTGSGKSELLQTWILSMCVNYHPHEVNFILIDYKGGGMANLFEGMPHVVGKITNIASNIKRSIISLNREKDRRMAIFEAAGSGVNNIDKYQKLFYDGKVKEPLPHLIIVADEFAELKKEQPQFISDLISIARVGRTLGIHLILATQKPSGIVDDQISGNSRFRLCLKVQDAGDSREMIGKPDASRITQAGRCYVKVGDNEVFELFQSFWSGAPYYENSNDQIAEEDENHVSIVEYSGKRISLPKKINKTKAEFDELAAIRNHIRQLAETHDISQLQGPWLEELSNNISLDSVIHSYNGFDGNEWHDSNIDWLKIPVGIYDAPDLQEQGILALDFATDGHYGIYGTTGTGKTSLLKTMIVSASKIYTPEDINFYIIDCGGWSMNTFADFPHVGGVILDVEEEKIEKFQKLIINELDKRRKLFLENTASSLIAYRNNVGKIPSIVIMIDNIMPIFDLYPDIEELLIRIARDGATYGMYLVYTANTNTGIRYKIVQNVKGAVAFELTDKGDYASIVGKVEGKFLPQTSGRAFYKSSSALEFQVAWYADGENEVECSNNIKSLAETMQKKWHGYIPAQIPVMPNKVEISKLKNDFVKRNKIPIGISYDTISTAFIDLEKNYCFVITGSIGSGKSTLLRMLAELLNNDNNLLYFIDSNKKTFADFKDVAEGYAIASDNDSVNKITNAIVQMLNNRKDAQIAASTEPEFDSVSFILKEKQICIFIDDISEFIECVDNETRNWVNNIARLAEDLGVLMLVCGRTADVGKLGDIEPLTNTLLKYQNGILMDGSPSSAGFFNNNLPYAQREQICDEGNAWLFFNGDCKKIKLPK